MVNEIKISAEQIKAECDSHYLQIERSRKRIDELRAVCGHEHVHEGLYSWRIGCIDPAIICSDCGQVIQFKSNTDK